MYIYLIFVGINKSIKLFSRVIKRYLSNIFMNKSSNIGAYFDLKQNIYFYKYSVDENQKINLKQFTI